MTYRLGTLSHGLLLYWQVCVLDAVFYWPR
jgi:hypothetical protein